MKLIKVFYVLIALGASLAFVYFFTVYAKELSYRAFYECHVEKTIERQVKPEYLK